MLEIRNLCKTYRPKRGVPVLAINNISLKFPEKGMVFLLGKSGSGKSTMLNLLGGLDVYDSGEIIIKGQSTKDFRQSYYDSYRNTYVGFIFQEYNVLEEFTVGANIALALELQGQKATDERLNDILKQVDLAGYGDRKPNELSGGQKQRVAIARALVKNPKIIMADEPTGALDSATGRQILDTLKRLSEDKLVIVVSHDREFAQSYGDRIIELEDGQVIRDIEFEHRELPEEKKLHFFEDRIAVPVDYRLTEEDRLAINAYLDEAQAGTIDLELLGEGYSERQSVPTKEENIVWEDKTPFELIKSKLPLKNAFKIGVSSLKYKKFRLVITILLSCVAFGLFGLADTFGSYKHIQTCVNSIIDSDVDYVGLREAKRYQYGDGEFDYYYDTFERKFDEEDIIEAEEATGIDLTGVIYPRNAYLSFSENLNIEKLIDVDYSVYATDFSGFAEVTPEIIEETGAKLIAGTYPDGRKNEILITEFICESFIQGGYYDYYNKMINTDTPADKVVYEEIKEAKDMLGKVLWINDTAYTICGILDMNIDWERYESLMPGEDYMTDADQLVNYALYNELSYLTSYSHRAIAMVGEGHLKEILAKEPTTYALSNSWVYYYTSDNERYLDISPTYAGALDDIKDCDIIWLDGEKTSLTDKDIIVSLDIIYINGALGGETFTAFDSDNYAEELIEQLGAFSSLTETYYSDNGEYSESSGYRVVGVIDTNKYPEHHGTVIMSDSNLEQLVDIEDTGIYEFAVGNMPKDEEAIYNLVEYCYDEESEYRCELENPVTYELDMVNTTFQALSKVFLYVGIGFAVFASIMLANFISTSIAYKKQEIGILRAIGSRGNDVFRIFFSESFVIAMINFVLSSVGVGVATFFINYVLREELGILITVLTFGPRQIILILVISILVAAVASFIPVRAIAAKKPIDAIRNR